MTDEKRLRRTTMANTLVGLYEVAMKNAADPDVAAELLGYAYDIAKTSRDPSTQVGAAVLTMSDGLYCACNNAPGWITTEELLDRDLKLRYTLHAERMAL